MTLSTKQKRHVSSQLCREMLNGSKPLQLVGKVQKEEIQEDAIHERGGRHVVQQLRTRKNVHLKYIEGEVTRRRRVKRG